MPPARPTEVFENMRTSGRISDLAGVIWLRGSEAGHGSMKQEWKRMKTGGVRPAECPKSQVGCSFGHFEIYVRVLCESVC